ncbi:ESPR domain-containing protein [Glaesserella parasuis]|nr:ESPR domain-containing protein [Glaesserella parasuis]
MNKIFRVIWNHAQQAWVVVSEVYDALLGKALD